MSGAGSPASGVDLLVQRLSPGVWRARLPMGGITANCYLLEDGGEAVLVDTAASGGSAGHHIDAMLATAGLPRSAITGLVLTHAHRDHIGHAASFADPLGVPTFMHPHEWHTVHGLATWCGLTRTGLGRWLRLHGMPPKRAAAVAARFAPEPHLSPVRVEMVQDESVVMVGKRRWLVLHVPGHTSGHICLYDPARKFLLTGDHVLPPGGGNAHVTVRPGSLTDPLGAYLASLDRVASLRVDLVLPGHGEPSRDLDGLVRRHRLRHAEMLDLVRALDNDPASSAYELALRLAWGASSFRKIDDKLQLVGLGEVLARRAHLLARLA